MKASWVRFVKDDVNNRFPQGCHDCDFWESGDDSVGLAGGCTHPILFDENDELIPEANDLIIEAMADPDRCVLAVPRNAVG